MTGIDDLPDQKIITVADRKRKLNNHGSIGLHDLIEGFLFSISAEVKSPRTDECYSDKLRTLLKYGQEHKWPDSINLLDVQKFREFLSWTESLEIIQTNCHG